MSYGTKLVDQHRRAADYVDKILTGAKSGACDRSSPTTFDLVINLKAVKAIGLESTPSMLAHAAGLSPRADLRAAIQHYRA
jgi:putative ABC transport system substrate-binding protein